MEGGRGMSKNKARGRKLERGQVPIAMGGRRGRHGERTKQGAGGKSQEQTRGPVPRAMGEGGGANDKLCAREGAR